MPKSTKSNSNEWTTSDDNKLLALYKRNVPEFALAKILKKSITQIRERIMYLMKNNQGGVIRNYSASNSFFETYTTKNCTLSIHSKTKHFF